MTTLNRIALTQFLDAKTSRQVELLITLNLDALTHSLKRPVDRGLNEHKQKGNETVFSLRTLSSSTGLEAMCGYPS